ncbi:MAG: hypothetical protein ABJP48_13660 [Erythrobacter sp.]
MSDSDKGLIEGAPGANSDAACEASQDAEQSPEIGAAQRSTNLLLADIILREASKALQNNLEKRNLTSNYEKTQNEKPTDGKSIISALTLYGASKLASRSVGGLAVVAGGLVAKALYERGKALEKGNPGQIELEDEPVANHE